MEGLEDFSDSEDESLSMRLARLRREPAEVKQELERTKAESKGEDEAGEDLDDGVSKLSHLLDGLHADSRREKTGEGMAGGALTRSLATDRTKPPIQEPDQSHMTAELQPSTNSKIATFSDRLMALETALGLSSTSSATELGSTAILPTVSCLSVQIAALSAIMMTPQSQFRSSTNTQTSRPSISGPSQGPLPGLDALAQRIRTLTTEADNLTLSRKRATEALQELQEARLKSPASGNYHGVHAPGDTSVADAQNLYDDQFNKINALYQTLPSIQNLQPLLPVVLQRLRSLQTIHAGAASAKADLDEMTAKQATAGGEIDRWKKGVEELERKVGEHERVLQENREVVGQMVEDVERRLGILEQ